MRSLEQGRVVCPRSHSVQHCLDHCFLCPMSGNRVSFPLLTGLRNLAKVQSKQHFSPPSLSLEALLPQSQNLFPAESWVGSKAQGAPPPPESSTHATGKRAGIYLLQRWAAVEKLQEDPTPIRKMVALLPRRSGCGRYSGSWRAWHFIPVRECAESVEP